ncbi:hypothetical protein [Tissierella praeacuta]|uniref:hypothetical protein n=1 Tax=Tissierella praeacuta TaxID=43131 RepID=UPI00333FF5C7
MYKKISILVLTIFLILWGLPTYAIEANEISPIKMVFQLIFYLIIFILVILFTIYGTRIIAKNYKGFTSSKYIDLLDVMNLPGGCKIIITRINQKIYILSVTNNNTSVIDVIEAEEFPICEEKFNKCLNDYLSKNGNEHKLSEKIENLINKINIKKG